MRNQAPHEFKFVDEATIKAMYQNLDEVKGQADLKGFYNGTIQVSNPLMRDQLYTQNVAYNPSPPRHNVSALFSPLQKLTKS